MLLQGKTAVISGAAGPRGIGLASAKPMAARGAQVAVPGLDFNAADQSAMTLGVGHMALGCDATDAEGGKSAASAQRGGGIFGGPHNSAAKADFPGLAKAMGLEIQPGGIRANCVAPGPVETDMTGAKLTPAMKADIIISIPLGRLGAAADVANIHLFQASDLSAYVTGMVIDGNGGMLIHEGK